MWQLGCAPVFLSPQTPHTMCKSTARWRRGCFVSSCAQSSPAGCHSLGGKLLLAVLESRQPLTCRDPCDFKLLSKINNLWPAFCGPQSQGRVQIRGLRVRTGRLGNRSRKIPPVSYCFSFQEQTLQDKPPGLPLSCERYWSTLTWGVGRRPRHGLVGNPAAISHVAVQDLSRHQPLLCP